MSDSLTTAQVILIASKELARPLPVIGQILSTIDAVSQQNEVDRVSKLLLELDARIDAIEKRAKRMFVLGPKAHEVILYGCGQARSDVLFDEKAAEYARVMAHHAGEMNGNLREVIEIMDTLKRLDGHDLALLYFFRNGAADIHEARMVTTLAGYKPGIDPFTDPDALRQKMGHVFPTLMRLQGLGILYLSMEEKWRGGQILDAGGLSQELRKTVFLTAAGKRLLLALCD